MKRQKHRFHAIRPKDSIVVTTYAQFEAIVRAFSEGHINLLIVIGEWGLGKGRIVRENLGENFCWIQGAASAFGIYIKLYEHRDDFIVINDVDKLHADKNGVRLLKCLCDTDAEKSVAWPTAARDLITRDIPQEFTTKSRVVILSNDWETLNRNVAAVQDRGHTVVFSPTPLEVHRKTAEWFRDEEVYDWIGERLHRISTPSMRLYIKARELKQSGLPWKELLPLLPENPSKRIASELLTDPTFETQEARAREFTIRGGGCRATYFNYIRRLRSAHRAA